MDITHIDDDKKGAWLVRVEGKRLAEMTYVWNGTDRIIVDHTQVDESLKGKGVGMQLFNRMVEFAREKKLTVIALCPFVKSVFDRFPDKYKDVLDF